MAFFPSKYSKLTCIYTIFPRNSEINTPKLYAKLKAGDFPVFESDTFNIREDAVANLLWQPKEFANSKYYSLVFIDDDANYISLQPHDKKINGAIAIYYELILGTPADYTEYKLSFAHDLAVCMKNIEYILNLTNATKLTISENSGAAYEMQQRPNQLNELKNLEEIDLSIAEEVHMKLRVTSFVNALSALKKATFTAYSLSAEHFDVFVQNQTIPSGWKCIRTNTQFQCTKG